MALVLSRQDSSLNVGLLPSWSKKGRLFGKHGRQDCEILPSQIVEVKEFGFNNPFLMVTTADGRFHVGVMTNQYDEVVDILGQYVGNSFRHRFAHRWNVFFFRKQFGFVPSSSASFWESKGRVARKMPPIPHDWPRGKKRGHSTFSDILGLPRCCRSDASRPRRPSNR